MVSWFFVGIAEETSTFLFRIKSFFKKKLGSISCKHIVRWQHLSQIKAWSFWLVEIVFFHIKTQQTISGTSAATYKLTELHWIVKKHPRQELWPSPAAFKMSTVDVFGWEAKLRPKSTSSRQPKSQFSKKRSCQTNRERFGGQIKKLTIIHNVEWRNWPWMPI